MNDCMHMFPQADLNLLDDCQRLQLAAWLSTDPAEAAQHAYFGKLAEDLRQACLARLDLITGHVLQVSCCAPVLSYVMAAISSIAESTT